MKGECVALSLVSKHTPVCVDIQSLQHWLNGLVESNEHFTFDMGGYYNVTSISRKVDALSMWWLFAYLDSFLEDVTKTARVPAKDMEKLLMAMA